MITKRKILFRFLTRKAVTLTLIGLSAFAAYATLGDGKSKGKKKSLLNKTVVTPGKFSLRSGYQYRGSQVINQTRSNNTITLNTVVTYQKGRMTYIVPLKTTVLTQKVKLGVGIPQLRN
jgi:hypothetical protein